MAGKVANNHTTKKSSAQLDRESTGAQSPAREALVSARREPRAAKVPMPAEAVVTRAPRKPRGPRVHLTHFEIRRGAKLCLRVAVADDALAEVGDELGALIKKIAPSTRTAIIPASSVVAETMANGPDDFLVTPQHEGDVDAYHADLREHLTELFSQLCDASLADALEIVREERARRAEGGN